MSSVHLGHLSSPIASCVSFSNHSRGVQADFDHLFSSQFSSPDYTREWRAGEGRVLTSDRFDSTLKTDMFGRMQCFRECLIHEDCQKFQEIIYVTSDIGSEILHIGHIKSGLSIGGGMIKCRPGI